MGTINVNAANFQQTIEDNDIVLFDWWAEWCGPCRTFAPVFEKAATQHTDITFAKIDTDAESGLAGALRIMSIPTLMAFRDGVMVFSQPGSLPGVALEELISKVRDLDMEQVHEQLAAKASR
jgi:thioredoxin 1